MSAKNVAKKLASSKRKKIAPHMWVIFKNPTGSYGVSLGDPRKSGSTLRAVLPNRHELEEWVHSNVGRTVSADHIIDTTGHRLVPSEHSDFYMQMRRG